MKNCTDLIQSSLITKRQPSTTCLFHLLTKNRSSIIFGSPSLTLSSSHRMCTLLFLFVANIVPLHHIGTTFSFISLIPPLLNSPINYTSPTFGRGGCILLCRPLAPPSSHSFLILDPPSTTNLFSASPCLFNSS